jgi:hypothetical protein
VEDAVKLVGDRRGGRAKGVLKPKTTWRRKMMRVKELDYLLEGV